MPILRFILDFQSAKPRKQRGGDEMVAMARSTAGGGGVSLVSS